VVYYLVTLNDLLLKGIKMLEIFKALDGKCITDQNGVIHRYSDGQVLFWINGNWEPTGSCFLSIDSKIVPDPSVKTLDLPAVIAALNDGLMILERTGVMVSAIRNGEHKVNGILNSPSIVDDGGWLHSPRSIETLVGGTVYEPKTDDEVCDKCGK